MSGGSVEHWNEEPGVVWLARLVAHFRRSAWLNPSMEAGWRHAMSVGLIRDAMGGRMFPLTLTGLDELARALAR